MVYIENVYMGLLVFPFIAAVITLPYALVEYHKHGSVSKFRTLILYSFVLYMLIAFFMVSLPLPDRASTVGNRWQDHLNLIPFRQIWLYWHGRALTAAAINEYLVSKSLWQLLFNILLTVPFGIYMRYYFRLDMRRTVLYSFLLSLFYETSQITALFGIYPGPYRLADVEDLICNTFGGMLGYHIAFVFTVLLPSREEIDAKADLAGRMISGKRRFCAVLFDYLCSLIIFDFLGGAIEELFPWTADFTIYGEFYNWTFFCIFSLLQVLATKGTTFGRAICRMTLVSERNRTASYRKLFRRYMYMWLFTDFPLIIATLVYSGQFVARNDFVIIALFIISRLYFLMYFLNEVLRKVARPMPHDRLSSTKYIATKIPDPRSGNVAKEEL